MAISDFLLPALPAAASSRRATVHTICIPGHALKSTHVATRPHSCGTSSAAVPRFPLILGAVCCYLVRASMISFATAIRPSLWCKSLASCPSVGAITYGSPVAIAAVSPALLAS